MRFYNKTKEYYIILSSSKFSSVYPKDSIEHLLLSNNICSFFSCLKNKAKEIRCGTYILKSNSHDDIDRPPALKMQKKMQLIRS